MRAGPGSENGTRCEGLGDRERWELLTKVGGGGADQAPDLVQGLVSAYDFTSWFGYDFTCWPSASGSWHGFASWDQREAVLEAVAGSVAG